MAMRRELRDAIESACSREAAFTGVAPVDRGSPTRRCSFGAVRAIVYAVVRELPDDMTAAEIGDELEISNNQAGET